MQIMAIKCLAAKMVDITILGNRASYSGHLGAKAKIIIFEVAKPVT